MTDRKKLRLRTLNRQKKSKIRFYLSEGLQYLVPRSHYRNQKDTLLTEYQTNYTQEEKEDIQSRVNYYNKLSSPCRLGPDAHTLSQLSPDKHSVYFFDLYRVLRYFNSDQYFHHLFGDVIEIPQVPSFVKSRPIHGDNANSVVLKLDSVRHFDFIDDPIPFRDKKDLVVWRGSATMSHRKQMLEAISQHPLCDIGCTNPMGPEFKPEWKKAPMPLSQQLEYKYILSIEGNDVATNLKWIMSSNALCFMKAPVYETWFMESTLIPGKHYVLLRSDYSDLDEKIEFYKDHPDEAEKIIRNAHQYLLDFKDKRKEQLVSLLVAKKYFDMVTADWQVMD